MRFDIFCNVIDNFGDIGVSWRICRQLAKEHGLKVRLWIDDLQSFCKLCPEALDQVESQVAKGIEVNLWPKIFPDIEPFDVVIEAFGCRLPENFLEKMVEKKPVWINLEYLSAEKWVEGCHGLPSLHPSLPLTKYFFFPGFTAKTGGLILEKDLLSRKKTFGREEFFRNLGMELPESLLVSFFCYENQGISRLLEAWAQGSEAVTCLIPEGRILPQVKEFFGMGGFGKGNLSVKVLPFVEQEKYDELLWACDFNFVRGEDSFVRAQWAQKPFVWHIYPQKNEAHLQKLDAFLSLYCESLPSDAESAMKKFWHAWNREEDLIEAWEKFYSFRDILELHAQKWVERHVANNLVLNLLNFCEKRARMSDFDLQGKGI